MHSKQIGVVGVWSVAKFLSELGLPVFIELSDLSKIDIITVFENIVITLQVKSKESKNGSVYIDGRKCGPNYQYTYQPSDFDFFAIYVRDKDLVLLIPSTILYDQIGMTIRFEDAKNKQQKGIHYAHQYSDITRILRDYTQNSLPSKKAGEDIVQTAKSKIC